MDAEAMPAGAPSTGPLAGVRVLELGQLLAGPFCCQLLGDLGAEVIKIEDPGRGDPMRQWGREKTEGDSLWWSVLARNKKSITVDLRDARGQDVVRRLARTADVLVENFRPGTLERWGLGYDVLGEANPRLILVRVTGYGQTGPYSRRAGYGSIGEAMGGLRYVVGDPTTAPSRVGISLGDSLAGTFGALGAMAALVERGESGQGQIVDSAIYESVLALMESLIPDYQLKGHIRERTGAILPDVAPSNVYPTKDGQMALVAANQDTVFTRLAEAMGRPHLASDPAYATHPARGQRQAELDELISAWTATMTWAELEALLLEHSVPVGLMYRAPDMLDDPHFAAREAIVRLVHPTFGQIAMHNAFPRLSRTPAQVRWVGPLLGEHTDEVLTEEGLTAEEITDLRVARVIQ